MPNEFDTNKNQLDLFSYAESKQNQQDKRQNLASSGFTATVWTLSGVVLAACSLFEDDEGGAGGGSVSVNASPVRDARLYFDIDGDGDVDENDVRIQNEQYPGGFTTDADGRATGIPLELLGRPYIADLNGAVDDATEHPLEGQYHSLEDEDGNHLIASPITALIAEAMADTNQPNTVSGVVAAFTPSGVDATELLEELRSRDSYLPGTESSERVIALSKYLADNKAREVVGREDTIAEQIAESQRIIGEVEAGLAPASTDAIVVLNEDADGDATNGVQVDMEVGEHDSYVGIINAFAQDGSALSYTLTTTTGAEYNGVYAIDDRGGISFADSTITPVNVMETFNVEISNGNPADTQIVVVTVTPDSTVHELMLDEQFLVGDIEENVLGSTADPLIAGIEVAPGTPGATVTAADFAIRDGFLNVFASKFEMVQDTVTPTEWNLQLIDGEYLDYEAIPGGEFELYISVDNGANGHHSNILTVTITVNDDPDDISFSGTLRADLREDDTTPPSTHLIAEGQVQIANQVDANGVRADVMLESTLSDGSVAQVSGTTVQTLTLDHGTFTYNHADNTWTYTVNNDAAAIQALVFGQATTEIVTLTIADPNNSAIMHTQSIVLNVHGANEDVRFEDANDVRTSIANVPDAMNIEIGDETALNGNFALGNVLTDLDVTLEGQLDRAETTTVAFADSVPEELRALFDLTPSGVLTFTGTSAQALAQTVGTIPLNLLVSTESTADDIPLTVRVNIVNLIDNDGAGSAIYEIDGDTSAEGNTLTAQIAPGGADVDGVMAGSERYQWYRGDDATNGVLVGSGSTYTVQTDDVDETITLIVTYTDGSGTPETSEAATTPVRITRPTAAELEFAENSAGETLTLSATSSDDTNPSVAISSFMFVYADQNGQEQEASDYQGFSISSSGAITLTGGTPLDYETASSYDLRIRATDANNEVGHLSITIRVGDVNDNAPVFTQSAYTADIDETLGNGAEVARVSARDDDGTTANNTVGYSITAGNTNNVFDIDDNGVITVLDANALDFETTPSYTLTITATDNGSPAMTDTATVTITVNDINDITPTYMVTAGENSASVRGTEAGGNSADVGTGYRITITDADTTNTFRGNFDVSDRRFDFVETSAGSGVWELTLLANEAVALSEASLTLTYQVHDGTNTAAGGRGSVTVAVVDSTVTYTATQNAPLEIAEADGIDTTTLGTGGVLAQVTAESSEGQTVTYTLTSAVDQNGADVSSLFTVDSDDGEVRFTDSTVNLDYEAVSEYSLVITASARQSATTMDTDDVPTTVIIRVMNVQEGDGTYIIEGNVAAGGRLNAVVTDPDGTRSVTYEWYSINPANNARTVLGATQSITLPGAADFDDSLTYHVDIVHIDNLGDRHEETLDASAVVFDIQNTDGNAFPSSIVENTDSLPVVVASLDGDTRTATYTFVGGDTITTSGVFTISQSGSTAGAITVNAPSDINFETAQEFNDGSRGYTLNVRATFAEDTANNLPEVTGDVVVTIIVTDVNEHAPVFVTNADDNTLSTGTDEIAEDAANGTRVGLFRATDADGSNNDVTYSLDDGGLGVFGIREVTGTNNWEIYVLNNANLDYDPTTTKPTPTRSYTIEITATDSDPDTTTRKSSGAEAFTINITDVNDNDPVLSATPVWEGTLDFGVPENTGTNVHLFTVSATDADENPSLTYEIVSIDGVALASIANPIFGIDASDGRVGLAGQLDRETKASHEIVIRAVDEGGRASNEETFTVTVGDVNDNTPVLGEPVWASDYGDNGVPEDAYTGAPLQIFTATATDRDANNGFSYEIVSVDGDTYDSSTSIFSIHAASGRVGITSALDYETAPEIMDDTNTVIGRGHEIVIVAIDNSGTGMRSEPGTITVLVANRDDGPAVFEVSPTQANDKILEVEVDTADPDGLDGTYSYQWFTTTDDGVTQVDITGENGRRFDTSGRSDPAGTVIGVRVEYTDNAGTEYSQANGNAPFAVNTTLRFTESYSITLTDGDASPTLPVFADDLELNGDAITTGLEFTFATNGNPGNLFTLSSAGVLTFTGSAVDFDMATDAQKSFNLLIVAEATAGGETTTAIIPVTVEDVNDNDPTLSEPFTTSDDTVPLSADDIDENATGAATSISFTASDADTVFSGAGQTELEFTITATAGTTDAQDIADMFEMFYDTGNDIYTLRLKDGMALNAEAAGLTTNGGVQQIELRIQATDGRTDMPTATPTAGQGLSDARTVTITVNDVNDFGPVFRNGAEHTETISEEMAVGTTVVSTNPAPARDGDATDANKVLTYSIVRVTSGGVVVTGSDFFTLDTSTGGITLAKKLDYETTGLISNASTERGYVIELLVEDQDGLQDTQMLTVVVTDEDDTDPAFGTLDWNAGGDDPSDPGSRLIDENTTGTLLTIPISDADTVSTSLNANLEVSIQGGSPVDSAGEPIFVFVKSADNLNAELRVNPMSELDFEHGTTYTLTLVVADARPTPGTATQTVTINVNNINEETPTFTNNPIVTWETGFELGIIPEDTDVSGGRVLVGRVAISDDDGATNFLDERVITIAGAGAKFEIERNTDTTANGGTLGEGLIYLNAALDREGVGADDAEYDAVKITVTDGSLPAVTSDAFSIFIDDVNEGDPVIAVTGSPASFTERTASGNEATGVTFTISDADTGSTYTSSEIALSGDSRFDFVWDEAMQSGTVVLKDTETLDYETAADRAITLTLTVTDPLDASVTDTETITINVGNADDVASEFADFDVSYWQTGTGSGVTGEEHIRTINEDQGASPILVIPVSDPDTATLTASIQGGSPEDASNNPIFFFGVSGDQAILSVIGSRLDYETAPNTYTLVLEVSDGTNTPAATQTVVINVGNVNEHGPVFGAELVDFETAFSNGDILENTTVGTVIGVVDVSDADGDVLTVTVLPGLGATQALADKFEVVYNMMDDQYELKLKTALDLEGATPDPTTLVGLRLRATDGTNSVDSPAATASQFGIQIRNVDDTAPDFGNFLWMASTATTTVPAEANTMRTIDENSTGTLAVISLIDPDTRPLTNLILSIDTGSPTDRNGAAIFTLVNTGGTAVLSINPNAELDYEHTGLNGIEIFRDADNNEIGRGYTLTLVVTDPANNNPPGVHRVTINVAPVDEGDAVFEITSDGNLAAPAVGDELTVAKTTDDPDGNPVAPNTFSYKWFRYTDGADITVAANRTIIANEIGTTYELQGDDAGNRIGVLVEYTDAGGHTESLPFAAPLTADVVSDFEVTGGTMGTAEQYDTSPVDATGTLTFGTESAMDVDSTGTYTIASQGTYGTVSLVPVNSDMSMGPIVTPGTWTYNVNNAHAAVKALRASDTTPLTDTFKIGVPLTAAAGGGVQEVTVTVDISGVATGAEIHGTSAANTGRSPGNPLDRATSDTFDVIQGGNGEDEIWTGSGGSLVIAGYGGDTITLGDGADTVVHRFWSRNDGAWRQDDGDDVIDDFEVGVDKLVLVDTDTVSPVDLATFLDESLSGQPGPTGGGRILIQLDYDTTITNAADFSLDGMVINIQGGSNVNGPGQGGGNTGASLTINFKDPIPAGTMSGLTDNLTKLTGFGISGAPPLGYIDSSGVELTKFEFLPNYFDIVDGSTDHFDVISLAELGIMIEDFA